VDDALSANGMCDGAALRGVLAFSFDGDRVPPERVELAFGKGLLVELAAFGRRRDWIEHASVCDTGFSVIGDQLIAVSRDTDAGGTRPSLHTTCSPSHNNG